MSEDNNKKVADNKKEQPEAPKRSHRAPASHPSRSALLWLVIFLALGSLVLVRGFDSGKVVDLSHTDFERELMSGKIVSFAIQQESGNIYSGEGKFKDATGNELKFATRLILTPELQKILSSKTKLTVNENSSGFWHIFLVGILPTLLIILAIFFFTRSARMGGKGALDFGKSRAKMLSPDEINVKFSDIAGADEAKEEIQEIVEFLKDPLRFQLVGGRIPKGCLLVGEPGTGKTLMAKAVACEAGVPFFAISGSDFVEMFVGVGASRVRDMFNDARKSAPCLIFIDEIDAVGRSRFSGWGGGHDEREQTLNAMLVEMDGLESRNGVIVLAATNRPDVLDPALLRPGRFDRQVVMDLPDINGRRQILNVHISKIKTDEKIDLDVIARTTPGFSGADLANLCNEAALLAARRNKECVTQAELEEARDKVSYGTERRSRKITERERRLTAYHEAGHTLVALFCKDCTPVHKVTIIPRGQAYLGATFTMPKEDVYTRTKNELIAQMAMTMGGRAAEELIFKDITTGATADIQQLTEIARKMVCVFGMSDKLGPIKLKDISIHPHLRIDGPQPDLISPETAREIDMEVNRLVFDALRTAREILTEHRDELEKLAQALLQRETLSIDEIKDLLGMEKEESAPEANLDGVDSQGNESTENMETTDKVAGGVPKQEEENDGTV